jgi:hypothetical protein
VPGACIEDVTFRNIHLYYKGGYSEEDGKRIPPEQEKVYPEPCSQRTYFPPVGRTYAQS